MLFRCAHRRTHKVPLVELGASIKEVRGEVGLVKAHGDSESFAAAWKW